MFTYSSKEDKKILIFYFYIQAQILPSNKEFIELMLMKQVRDVTSRMDELDRTMKIRNISDLSLELDMMELYLSTLTIDGQSEELMSLGEEAVMKMNTIKSKIQDQNDINEVFIILNDKNYFKIINLPQARGTVCPSF